MTKQLLGKYLQSALELNGWLMNARLPSVIRFAHEVAGGLDEIYLQPKRGVYAMTFGNVLSASRAYYPVRSILKRAGVVGAGQDSSLRAVSRYSNDLYTVDIVTPADFEPWLPTARAMVHEDVLPELERYRYLGPLHERIAAEPLEKWSSFVANPPHPHVAIIKYLVGAEDWQDFLLNAIASYREYSTGKYASAFLPHIPVLESLREILPTVTPLSPKEIWGPGIS